MYKVKTRTGVFNWVAVPRYLSNVSAKPTQMIILNPDACEILIDIGHGYVDDDEDAGT